MYAVRSGGKLLTSANAGLSLTSAKATSGTGTFGAYTGYTLDWAAAGAGSATLFETNFYVYDTLPGGGGAGGIVFEQVFPQGLVGSATGGNNELSTAFPSFGPSLTKLASDLGFLTWTGVSVGAHAGQWTTAGVNTGDFGTNGGVVTLFNSSGYAATFSPLTDHLTAQPSFPGSLGEVFAIGFNGKLAAIPVGYRFSSVLVAGQGITDTMHAWGDMLLTVGNKPRTTPTQDFQTAYLSYWTDNGEGALAWLYVHVCLFHLPAPFHIFFMIITIIPFSLSPFFSGAYYYYHTETGKNYQQTMLDVKAYVIDQAKLPVRAFQFDSWWYTRGSGPNGGGVVLW